MISYRGRDRRVRRYLRLEKLPIRHFGRGLVVRYWIEGLLVVAAVCFPHIIMARDVRDKEVRPLPITASANVSPANKYT